MNFLARSAYATFVLLYSFRLKPKSPSESPSLELQDKSAILYFSESPMVICLDTTNLSSSILSIFLKLKKHSLESLWNLEIVPSHFSMVLFAQMTLELVNFQSFRIHWCRSCSFGRCQAQRKRYVKRWPPPRKCQNFHSSRKSYQRLCSQKH